MAETTLRILLSEYLKREIKFRIGQRDSNGLGYFGSTAKFRFVMHTKFVEMEALYTFYFSICMTYVILS